MEIKSNQSGFFADFDYGRLDISTGENTGFRPCQLMIASIAACSGAVFRRILEKKRLHLEDLTIKAKEERLPEEANRIKSIHFHFILKGKGLRTETIEKALQAAMKNCAMAKSVENSIDMKKTFDIIHS
ncbi:OsmC family protein [Bacillus sonorensis]|uniref:OsmC family protein n=1 Tax=Bacillus sonorensis TaxID=119858 RepID=UPI002280CFFB|nr:OsmC family protein [Bacillus sonorensis]MCY8027744.1 OsmC family protein [Bacillus sonorensis]MDI3409865.1 OsmC family protein [Bacillus sonorensis]